MKTVKVKFSGFNNTNTEPNFFIDILRKYYNVELSDNPDYLFYGIHSFDFLKYNCIRIFYSGENLCPDFNICDYALGFDYMNFGDRYCRLPNYIMTDYTLNSTDDYKRDLNLCKLKHKLDSNILMNKKNFCNFVYSNDVADPIRKEFYKKLTSYKKIDSGGRYLNNVGGPIKDKFLFQQKYKFSIAFENSPGIGYTTEKIVQAFAAQTIPIYWGNDVVDREFNKAAFINVNDYDTLDGAIEKIKKIDQNEELWIQMMKQPAFVDPSYPSMVHEEVEKFIIDIFNQDVKNAIRRKTYVWGLRHERQLKYGIILYPKLRSIFRILKKLKLKK